MHVKTLAKGGEGGEAVILYQERNYFPGRGGPLFSDGVLFTALREEFNNTRGLGERLFFKHLIGKKLDDYFLRQGKYLFKHIPRPLGSITGSEHEKDAYLYEWTYGAEGFSWVDYQKDGVREQIILDEWNEFVTCFDSTGISVGYDVCDANDGRISQNIIHLNNLCENGILAKNWRRIDFGNNSLPVNYERLLAFLKEKADGPEGLKTVLGINRFELILLATKSLMPGKMITEREEGRLDILTREYRISTIKHHRPRMIID